MAATAYAAFSLGAAECKISMEGLTTSQVYVGIKRPGTEEEETNTFSGMES